VSELDARGHLSGLLRLVQPRQDAVPQQPEVMTSPRLHAQNCLLKQTTHTATVTQQEYKRYKMQEFESKSNRIRFVFERIKIKQIRKG